MDSKYPILTIGEVCDLGDGAHAKVDRVRSGVPYLTSKNIGHGRLKLEDVDYISEEDFDRLFSVQSKAVTRLMPGDLLTGIIGTFGNLYLYGENDRFGIASAVAILRSNPDRLFPRYLYYYATSSTFQGIHQAFMGGSVQGYTNLPTIRRLPIILPPLAEQKAIAAALGALDDKIEFNRRMNTTLEAMARALFQSWFVDFDPVRAKLDGRKPDGLDKATADLFPEHLEESTIGKKPRSWEVSTLETVLDVLETGGRPKGGVGGITSGVPSIGAESIVGVGHFDFGKTKFVPVEFFERMNKGHIESHDVLIYKDGGRPGEYEPHVSMFGDGFPFEECSINEHVYRLRANERMSQEYLYFWLTSELALAEMRMKGTGVAIPGLNSTAVRSLAVLVPPQSVVGAYTRQAAPLITQILANAKQSHTLATLRDTLLPKLLSGELRVRDAAHLPGVVA